MATRKNPFLPSCLFTEVGGPGLINRETSDRNFNVQKEWLKAKEGLTCNTVLCCGCIDLAVVTGLEYFLKPRDKHGLSLSEYSSIITVKGFCVTEHKEYPSQ